MQGGIGRTGINGSSSTIAIPMEEFLRTSVTLLDSLK